MASYDVDLFVIGAGSGGVRAARIAAGYGAKVMVAEEYRVGGTCVIRGCVPKKLMVYASRFSETFAEAAGFGWTVEGAKFDWATLCQRRDAEVARLEGLYGQTLGRASVEIVAERAVIEGPNAVRLVKSGKTVTARIILVATGARPEWQPAVPGIELGISSNEIFHVDPFPQRLLVVGAGYIAVEFAGVFNGLGSQVTMAYRAPMPLRGFDEDLVSSMTEAYIKHGIAMKHGTTVERIEKVAGGLKATFNTGEVAEYDQILVATGRAPNTNGLGLEQVGINVDKAGAIPVDKFSKTSVPSIYAVGDVTNRANLTPVAIREGHAFADTVFGSRPTEVDHELMATAVFSTPELGTIGLTEEAARKHYGDDELDIYRSTFRPMRATLSGLEDKMMMKLVVAKANGRVLGVHVAGHDAGEIVQAAAIAVTMGATKADFDRTMAVHPTAGEELVTMRTPLPARKTTAAA